MGQRIQSNEARDAADVENTEVRPCQASVRPRVSESLEALLQRAREAFERLGDDDPSARLLQVAMLRRDEVLLEALLRRLDSGGTASR